MDAASKHSKVNNEAYENLEGMVYFEDTRFTPDLSNLLFKFRTRMFNVRNNFRNQYRTNLLCPLCNENEDSQEHLLKCKIITKELGSVQCQYEDIFSKDPECLLKIAEVLKKAIKVRIDKENEISTFLLQISTKTSQFTLATSSTSLGVRTVAALNLLPAQ